MSHKSESQMRKTIVQTAINILTAPVYTHAVSRDNCIRECFTVAMNDPEMRQFMNTRTDRQIARMGGDVKRGIDRHFNRQIVREVYVAHSTIGYAGHKVCIERTPRGGGDRTARWYGIPREVVREDGHTEWVERRVTESSLKRLNQAMLSIQVSTRIEGIANAEWTVGCGIFKYGMYTRLWR